MENEGILPWTSHGTPLLNIGFTVYSESIAIIRHLKDEKKAPENVCINAQESIENLKTELITYKKYIEEHSWRDLKSAFFSEFE